MGRRTTGRPSQPCHHWGGGVESREASVDSQLGRQAAGDHHGHHEAFPAFLLQASSSHPASAHYLPAASKAVKTMLNLVKVDNRLIGGILVEDDIKPWSWGLRNCPRICLTRFHHTNILTSGKRYRRYRRDRRDWHLFWRPFSTF